MGFEPCTLQDSLPLLDERKRLFGVGFAISLVEELLSARGDFWGPCDCLTYRGDIGGGDPGDVDLELVAEGLCSGYTEVLDYDLWLIAKECRKFLRIPKIENDRVKIPTLSSEFLDCTGVFDSASYAKNQALNCKRTFRSAKLIDRGGEIGLSELLVVLALKSDARAVRCQRNDVESELSLPTFSVELCFAQSFDVSHHPHLKTLEVLPS